MYINNPRLNGELQIYDKKNNTCKFPNTYESLNHSCINHDL